MQNKEFSVELVNLLSNQQFQTMIIISLHVLLLIIVKVRLGLIIVHNVLRIMFIAIILRQVLNMMNVLIIQKIQIAMQFKSSSMVNKLSKIVYFVKLDILKIQMEFVKIFYHLDVHNFNLIGEKIMIHLICKLV